MMKLSIVLLLFVLAAGSARAAANGLRDRPQGSARGLNGLYRYQSYFAPLNIYRPILEAFETNDLAPLRKVVASQKAVLESMKAKLRSAKEDAGKVPAKSTTPNLKTNAVGSGANLTEARFKGSTTLGEICFPLRIAKIREDAQTLYEEAETNRELAKTMSADVTTTSRLIAAKAEKLAAGLKLEKVPEVVAKKKDESKITKEPKAEQAEKLAAGLKPEKVPEVAEKKDESKITKEPKAEQEEEAPGATSRFRAARHLEKLAGPPSSVIAAMSSDQERGDSVTDGLFGSYMVGFNKGYGDLPLANYSGVMMGSNLVTETFKPSFLGTQMQWSEPIKRKREPLKGEISAERKSFCDNIRKYGVLKTEPYSKVTSIGVLKILDSRSVRINKSPYLPAGDNTATWVKYKSQQVGDWVREKKWKEHGVWDIGPGGGMSVELAFASCMEMWKKSPCDGFPDETVNVPQTRDFTLPHYRTFGVGIIDDNRGGGSKYVKRKDNCERLWKRDAAYASQKIMTAVNTQSRTQDGLTQTAMMTMDQLKVALNASLVCESKDVGGIKVTTHCYMRIPASRGIPTRDIPRDGVLKAALKSRLVAAIDAAGELKKNQYAGIIGAKKKVKEAQAEIDLLETKLKEELKINIDGGKA